MASVPRHLPGYDRRVDSGSQDIRLEERLRALWSDLEALRDALRNHTSELYGRLNPFVEDLFDWKAKGEAAGAKGVTIYDSTTLIGDVSIGADTWIGPFCMLDGSRGLRIGANCSIATGAQLLSHDTVAWAVSGGRLPYEYAPVAIGDRCFVGVHAVVTRGVTIGAGCIIGAGAVVTDDLPAGSVAVGVPARVVGEVEAGDDSLIYRWRQRP